MHVGLCVEPVRKMLSRTERQVRHGFHARHPHWGALARQVRDVSSVAGS